MICIYCAFCFVGVLEVKILKGLFYDRIVLISEGLMSNIVHCIDTFSLEKHKAEHKRVSVFIKHLSKI